MNQGRRIHKRHTTMRTPFCVYALMLKFSLQALKRLLFDFTGQFDEKVFSGLDFVLAEAGRRGLKLILALTNYWTPFGGMAQYVK